MKKAWDTFLARAARYRESTAWLIGDLARYRRARCIRIMVLIGAALGFRLLAFYVLSRYIHLLESKEVHHIPLLGPIIPSQSYELLVMASVGCLCAFIAGAGAKYLAEVDLLKLMADYEVVCIQRAADAIARYGGDKRLAKWLPHYSKLISGDARSCSLVARMIVRFMMPFSVVIITTAALLYLDAVLTTILLVLMAVCAPIFYRINVAGIRHSSVMESKMTEAVKAKRQAIEDFVHRIRMAEQAGGGQADLRNLGAARVDVPAVRDSIETYSRRLRATEESGLLINLLMGVAFFVILFYKGWQILGEERGWAFIAIYFLVLRLCLSGVMQSANMITGINRLYHQISRYQGFMAAAAVVARSVNSAPVPEKFWILDKPGARATTEDEDELE